MAPPGIHRTPAKVAAKQRSKAREALDFFIALPSIESHWQLSGGYYFERFDENGTFYTVCYVGARGEPMRETEQIENSGLG